MKYRNAAAAAAIFSASMLWAQGQSSSHPRSVLATSNVPALAENARAQSAMHQRVEEMGNTLTKMHAILKQMQAKAAANSTKDSATKANLEMWALLLSDLDKQYEQLRASSRSREDLEARRAAMYKQAEERAAAEAKLAKGQVKPPAQSAAAEPAASKATDSGSKTPAPAVQAPVTPSSPN